MGFSAMADQMMWPPSLSRDRKWARVTKCSCTHSSVVGLRLEAQTIVDLTFASIPNYRGVFANYRFWQRVSFFNALVWGRILSAPLRNLASRNYVHHSIVWCKNVSISWTVYVWLTSLIDGQTDGSSSSSSWRVGSRGP